MTSHTRAIEILRSGDACSGPIDTPLSHFDDWNPLQHPIWLEEPLTREMIQAALDADTLVDEQFDHSSSEWDLERHAQRVAYLVRNPPTDSIELDMTALWPLIDGHHRLAAAFFRGDSTIRAEYAGYLDEIANFLEAPEDPHCNTP